MSTRCSKAPWGSRSSWRRPGSTEQPPLRRSGGPGFRRGHGRAERAVTRETYLDRVEQAIEVSNKLIVAAVAERGPQILADPRYCSARSRCPGIRQRRPGSFGIKATCRFLCSSAGLTAPSKSGDGVQIVGHHHFRPMMGFRERFASS
jgi:hypothetical protein